MRNLLQEDRERLYEIAEKATQLLAYALQEELSAFVMSWYSNEVKKKSAAIVFNTAENLQKRGVYGDTPGLYLSLEGGDIEIYFPKTTYAFGRYLETISDLHEEDDNLYYETVPDMIDMYYLGDGNLEIYLLCNIISLPLSEAYVSARAISEEIVSMLNGVKVYNEVAFYEGDDDGEKNLEADPNNYFVGVKLCCNIKDMR